MILSLGARKEEKVVVVVVVEVVGVQEVHLQKNTCSETWCWNNYWSHLLSSRILSVLNEL